MSRSPFRLTKTIGRNYSIDTDDVLLTKRILEALGYFEIPAHGINRYPDEPMFKGIEQLQDDFDLQPDGVVKPGGETEEKINEALYYRASLGKSGNQDVRFPTASRTEPSQKDGPLGDSRPDKNINDQTAAIPIIVYEIAAAFSMSLAAAYAWWLSLPAQEKKKVRERINNVQEHGTVDCA